MHFEYVTKQALSRFIPTVRPDDIMEIEIMSGVNYKYALREAFEDSDNNGLNCPMFMLCSYFRHEVYAVGGYDMHGCVWFVTSTLVDSLTISEKAHFIRNLEAIKHDAINYSIDKVLSNYALRENTLHIKLLKKLGADFKASVIINGHEFLPFDIT